MYAAPPKCNLVVLRSPDIHRAAEFYLSMGLLIGLESHGNGPEHYACCVDGFVFEIYPLSAGQEPTTSVRIGFDVDDVDGLVEGLEGDGAEVIRRPADSPWGRRAVVKDFDGHVVELLTPTGRDAKG